MRPEGPRFPAIEVHPELQAARDKLYGIAGGSLYNTKVGLSRITTKQRAAYFESPEFVNWVASEKNRGREVFWLKDLDKTQAAGDIFTFFFKWRADNGKMTAAENEILKAFLKEVKARPEMSNISAKLGEELAQADRNDAAANAGLVVRLWRSKERLGTGIGLLEFWDRAYWPSQKGLTREEKFKQAEAFAPHYAAKIYPGVPEENRALAKAGVEVVLVSNGDQELAKAVAPLLGIAPGNAVASPLIYDDNGLATGEHHTYEDTSPASQRLPQEGKHLSFHYWLRANRERWGWKSLELDRIRVAGKDGDSAAADGGMMINMPTFSRLGNFLVDTPHEPGRIKKFLALIAKYGYNWGQTFTLRHDPASLPAWSDADAQNP